MNFSIKSLAHSLDHIGHSHGTAKLFSPGDILERLQFKSHLRRFLLSLCAASAVYLLLTQLGAGPSALTALAGVSAFLYLGLLFEHASAIKMFLNLLATPLIFGVAYVSLSGSATYMAAAFVLHTLAALIQITGREKPRKAQLYGWAWFNLCLALLIQA
ncbi:MAG: hypothetical protein RQ754_13695 [Desulfuromonadales bacterium]|nr:hypothetical protein [Desulfuromonadales bacterium]